MPKAESDRVVVSVMAPDVYWAVAIDLKKGTATRTRPQPLRGPLPIAKEKLDDFRARAAKAFAAGDFVHRQQFADGETHFDITLKGRTVHQSHVTWGVGHHGELEPLYEFACSCL